MRGNIRVNKTASNPMLKKSQSMGDRNNKGSDKNGPNDSGPNDEQPNADRPNNDGAPHEDASNDGDQMKPDPMHCNDRWQSS